MARKEVPFVEEAAKLTLASIEGLGRRRFERLLRAFGSAREVLRANAVELLHHGVSLSCSERIIAARETVDRVAARWDVLKQIGAEARFCDSAGYPSALKAIADAPTVLIVRGIVETFSERTVAIVGTRRPDRRALRAAEDASRIARERGWCVVSGLALGIDGAAHSGALSVPRGGGDAATIAVLGGGLSFVYPPEHVALAERIADEGAVVTERLWGSVRPRWLVQRNRIISGLSRGVLVIQAEEGDGSRHAVAFAAKQRRAIAVWDWAGTRVRSRGTRQLVDACGVPAYNDTTLPEWLRMLEAEGDFAPPWLLFERARRFRWRQVGRREAHKSLAARVSSVSE